MLPVPSFCSINSDLGAIVATAYTQTNNYVPFLKRPLPAKQRNAFFLPPTFILAGCATKYWS